MDEGELWIQILEAIGRHALACAAEIRALRARLHPSPEPPPADLDG